MNIVNLTPHALSIFNAAGEKVCNLLPSGEVARIPTSKKQVGEVDGIPLFETMASGTPTGLPDPVEGTIYVVSGVFRLYFDRDDLYQPGELKRDEKGVPNGCIGLSR